MWLIASITIFFLPLVVVAGVLPKSLQEIILFINPLNLTTLSLFSMYYAYVLRNNLQKTKEIAKSKITIFTGFLCIFWSAAIPFLAGSFSEQIYNQLFNTLVAMFVFDALVAGAYMCYLLLVIPKISEIVHRLAFSREQKNF